MNKRKHRDVRVGIVLRRKLNREPDEIELSNAVGDGDDRVVAIVLGQRTYEVNSDAVTALVRHGEGV